MARLITDAERGRVTMLVRERTKEMRAWGAPDSSIEAMERQLLRMAEAAEQRKREVKPNQEPLVVTSLPKSAVSAGALFAATMAGD